MPKFCTHCGRPLPAGNAGICPSCGARFAAPLTAPAELRSPVAALALSFFFPGWGQWYNGKTWDGLAFFGTFVVLYIFLAITFVMFKIGSLVGMLYFVFVVLVLAVWLYGMYHAYRTSEGINRGEVAFARKSSLFWLPVILVIVGILAIIAAAVVAAFIFGMAGTVSKTMVVAVTAQKEDANHILVTYQGGQDADKLEYLTARVTDSSGMSQSKTLGSPGGRLSTALKAGDSVEFTGPYTGRNPVIVTGTFIGDSQQVLLDTVI